MNGLRGGGAFGDGDGDSVRGGNRRRVQVRSARKDGFGAAKRQVVLDHMAGCASLKRAAEAAKVSTVTVNYHRRRDPEFAAQFDEALEAGYAALEAALLERAAGAHYVPGPDAEGAPGPETVDTALGLHLLSIRQKATGAGGGAGGARAGSRTGQAGPPARRASDTELNAAILAKLDVLDRRTAAGRPVGFRGKQGTTVEGAGGAGGGEAGA